MNADILGSGGWLQISKSLIRHLGLQAAAYVASASDALKYAVDRGKVDPEGFFRIDRDKVSKDSGVTASEQAECESLLEGMGLLRKKEGGSDLISLDAGGIVDLIRLGTPDTEKEVKKEVASRKSQAKEEGKAKYMAQALKSKIKEKDIELRQALYEWVDSVVPRANAATVAHFEADLDSYAKEKKTKLELIKLASIYGYRNFEWAKERYEKSVGAEGRQKIASSMSEVDEERTF